ncbi:1-deoxy-D-xylulose-5-phosphate synthase [Helicobacter kayseriensis]|uniref:1-deoxy-D-xylulose-5-phosphate synthase n=1 Tax=Helicobacter kayseriensis TaxID=2905877 RepID=UPI001E3334DB|nr:1-deoxy-D-xylulose-5-phosphate synthase [Helicobacter kayseriensis]MCE3046848.1 1-deoxy-D-xylulose-5-phosphate synthase [Helicobacter kayseriensis]MCE3047850.1 1-deoxy-D-xylulose-5-phosphate synthase [Helicobacter kayseriensis]
MLFEEEIKDPSKLEEIASQLRNRILEVVSQKGGHLSPSLGALDLIVAMHHVFDCKKDPFIFDVGHQAYAHKLLTGRWEEFENLRQFGGMSGFPHPKESECDFFIAGHSSTSISLALGCAKAFSLQQSDQIPIALIGDGAMSAGLVYEALNELGERKYPMIIVLNDNEMSISKPIGAISRYLSQMIASPFCQNLKGGMKKILSRMPQSATYMARKFEESFKLISPGIIFEELGLNYIGPIDGHNLEEIIFTLKRAKEMKAPVIIHAQTIKGKGYKNAEGRHEKWHGVTPFDLHSGESLSTSGNIAPTKVFSQTLLQMAEKDEKIVGITAAMPSGTGMDLLMETYPHRFWDVAIAEAHGVTSMAAMAKMGFKPFVAIYSTFLQRAYDEIVHDVGILSLPVRFILDRAGIVGEDGETHQGLLDVAYLRSIPNMVLFAPRDNASLQKALYFASKIENAPCALRFPRGRFMLQEAIYSEEEFEMGKMELLHLSDAKNILLIGYGNGVGRAHFVREILLKEGIDASLVDLRFCKPLDQEGLTPLIQEHRHIFVLSDTYEKGGVGSAILEMLSSQGICKVITSFEVKDMFVPHGRTERVEEMLGLLPSQIAQVIQERIA